MGKQSSSSFVLCLFTLLHLPVLQSMGGKNKKKKIPQTNKQAHKNHDAVVRRQERTWLKFSDPFHPLGRGLKSMCLLPARALCLSTAGLTLNLFLSACIVLAGCLCPSGDAPTQDLLLSA